MARVPREAFVPPDLLARTRDDSPLPIGCGQTISQPFIVAWMTEALRVGPADRVLEIGTGSGYQTAVLAALAGEVWSIELEPELHARAAAALARWLGARDTGDASGDGGDDRRGGRQPSQRYGRLAEALRVGGQPASADPASTEVTIANVHLKIGDGYDGWPEAAPFDRIILTAAPPAIPGALVDQLAEGGRLVAPVGVDDQVIEIVTKRDGEIRRETALPVRFVPMRRAGIRP
jgi:protein-L-isoaspartate(D-aspartate) O-methyltransferase